MAQVNIGAIKFNWKGPYNNGTTYAVDDVVSSGGSSYVCILASQGNAVSNGTYWQIMSSAGTDADLLNISSTAQGDLYYNSGSAIARLAAGTSGMFLKTQGASANPVWAAAGGDNTPAFRSRKLSGDGTTALSANTWTKVLFPSEEFDTDNAFNVSNGRFTPQTAGKYFIMANLVGTFSGSVPGSWNYAVYKNGSKYVEIGYSTYGSNAGLVYVHNVHAIVDMNGSSDYIEIFARTNVSSAYIDQNATDTNVQGFKIIT